MRGARLRVDDETIRVGVHTSSAVAASPNDHGHAHPFDQVEAQPGRDHAAGLSAGQTSRHCAIEYHGADCGEASQTMVRPETNVSAVINDPSVASRVLLSFPDENHRRRVLCLGLRGLRGRARQARTSPASCRPSDLLVAISRSTPVNVGWPRFRFTRCSRLPWASEFGLRAEGNHGGRTTQNRRGDLHARGTRPLLCNSMVAVTVGHFCPSVTGLHWDRSSGRNAVTCR